MKINKFQSNRREFLLKRKYYFLYFLKILIF